MAFSLDRFVKEALEEDIQSGDHTTLSCISVDEIGSAELIVKEDGILAGVQIAERIFHQFDPTLEIEHLKSA